MVQKELLWFRGGSKKFYGSFNEVSEGCGDFRCFKNFQEVSSGVKGVTKVFVRVLGELKEFEEVSRCSRDGLSGRLKRFRGHTGDYWGA